MAWLEIMPEYEALFQDWDDATRFLDWQGILVNCHRRRRVEEVCLPDANEPPSPPAPLPPPISSLHGLSSNRRGERGGGAFFLKKESAIPWHERFLNAWQGFGWCATAVREGATLIAAKRAGLGCPDVAAFGEHERSAFLLLRGEVGMVELRSLLPTLETDAQRHRLAESLGRALARIHDAGFEHPDLFAKHVLVAPTTHRIVILDWARARYHKSVPWRTRLRDLAVLDATLHATLASDPLRLRVLSAYLKATRNSPPLARAAMQIRRLAQQMRNHRHVREIGQPAALPHEQQFVPACDGRLLIVRSYFEHAGRKPPAWLARLCGEVQTTEDALAFRSDHVTTHLWPRTTPAWEIPSLAHVLFRLGRFGVPTPRLLAVGADATRVFAVTECAPTTPFGEAFAKAASEPRRTMLAQAGRIVRQIHEAGYQLPPGDAWPRRLGVDANGIVLLVKIEPLVRTVASWQELAPAELGHERWRLTQTERLSFLQGYLGSDAKGAIIDAFMNPSERQRAA